MGAWPFGQIVLPVRLNYQFKRATITLFILTNFLGVRTHTTVTKPIFLKGALIITHQGQPVRNRTKNISTAFAVLMPRSRSRKFLYYRTTVFAPLHED